MEDQPAAELPSTLVLVEHPARRRGADGNPAEPPELIPGVGLVLLNRPKAFNALSFGLLLELADAVEALEADPDCRVIVITGSGTRAFASGADVAELSVQTPESLATAPGFAGWDRVAAVSKPTIAAVRGYALGGGAELALACDMLVAGDDAVFGQPEIDLGVIPGAGGTQRLAVAAGKARTMDLVLTGRRLGAAEAERLGFVTRVVPASETLASALDLAAEIAGKSPEAVSAAVAAVRGAFEGPLAAGIEAERARFRALFGSEGQAEGMRAFLERRRPDRRGSPSASPPRAPAADGAS